MTIKPLAYMSQDKLTRPLHEATVVEKFFKEEDIAEMTPLYAIPEGYHITAINHDQAIKDSLEQRNDKLRSDDA